MLKKKRENRSSEIIDWFYNQEFDKDTEDRIKKKFTLWYANEEDEQKDEILDELLRLELFGEGEGDNELHISPEKIAKHKLLLEKYNATESDKTEVKKLKRNIPFSRVLLRVAAVVIPLLIVGGVWMVYDYNKVEPSYANLWVTPNGVIEDVKLPDSTKVKINAGSTLNIKQDGKERLAELSGEGYFEVAKDTERPFKVVTQELTVSVLGTEFNVEAYPGSNVTIVTLLEGSVSLTTKDGKEWVLSPNQSFVFDIAQAKGQILNLTQDEAQANASWTTGRTEYNYRTLQDIFNIVERRFAVEIIVDAGVNMTGNEYVVRIDRDETLEMVMNTLETLTDKFSFRIENNRIYILTPKVKSKEE